MIFVIKYDRKTGVSQDLGRFDEGDMAKAQELRFNCEVDARGDDPRPEIVVLSAESEDALRRSHAKYFGDDAIRTNIRRHA